MAHAQNPADSCFCKKIGLLELKLPFYVWRPYSWTSLSPSLPLLPSFCLTFLSSALLSDSPRGFLFYWSFQRTYWRLYWSRLLHVHSPISLFFVYLWLCFTLLLISFLPELSHSPTCLQSYMLSNEHGSTHSPILLSPVLSLTFPYSQECFIVASLLLFGLDTTLFPRFLKSEDNWFTILC